MTDKTGFRSVGRKYVAGRLRERSQGELRL